MFALALISFALSAVATVGQMNAARKAAKAQRQSNDFQRQQQVLQQAKERRQQIQEARIRQGQIAQSAANQGALNSSGFLGGFGSVGTQSSTNLGFLNTQSGLAANATAANNSYASATAQQSLWSGVGSLANTGLSYSATMMKKST